MCTRRSPGANLVLVILGYAGIFDGLSLLKKD